MNNGTDLVVTNTSLPAADISYYDDNECSTIEFRTRYFTLSKAAEFIVKENTTVKFRSVSLSSLRAHALVNNGNLVFDNLDTLTNLTLHCFAIPVFAPTARVFIRETCGISSLAGEMYIDTRSWLSLEQNSTLTLDGNIDLNFGENPSSAESGLTLQEHSSLVDANIIAIQPGATLSLKANSSIDFARNGFISISGQLLAAGTIDRPVTLTRTGARGTWGGIVADDPSAAPVVSLSFANLTHCGVAISIHAHTMFHMDRCIVRDATAGIQIVSACTSQPDSMWVTGNTFSNIATVGILVDCFSNIVIANNSILGPAPDAVRENTYGILCISSSPRIIGNTVQAFGYGIQCLAGSSPMLYGKGGGNNTIRNNDRIGIACKDGSDAVLGPIDSPGDEGRNSIYGNSITNLGISNESVVFARGNWWGDPNDSGPHFDVDGTSTLDYAPWLLKDTHAQDGATRSESDVSPPPREGGSVYVRALMNRALMERLNGCYAQAMESLKSIIANEAVPSYARSWAVSQLLAVAQQMPKPNLSPYVFDVMGAHPTLARRFMLLMPGSFLCDGSVTNAMASFDENILKYPHSELELASLYGKFALSSYWLRDSSQSQALVVRLQNDYPKSAEATVARMQLEHYHATGSRRSLVPDQSTSPTGKILPDVSAVAFPGEFSLSQNYPNPFNPTTSIRFQIMKSSQVELKVFDILGREVATLVDERLPAGTHETTFNAKGLASGVYLYRLQVRPLYSAIGRDSKGGAGEDVQSKRLILLK